MKEIPEVGDEIYVPTSWYIDRGEDDVMGGLGTIDKVTISDRLPIDHTNAIFISIKEVHSHRYNYKLLIPKQEELKARFGDNRAYNDPDYG